MSYSKENFSRVTREFADKKARAISLAQERRATVHAAHPDIAEIDSLLSMTCAKIVDEISKGSLNIDERIKRVKDENLALQARRAELLLSYGYPADYTDIKYSCTECQDTGYTGYKMCRCMKKALTEAGYKSSGIGRLFETQSFESFSLDYYSADTRQRMAGNLELCKYYAANFDGKNDRNLLFFGGTGLGKTHLTTSIAAVVIEKGFDVVYDSSQNIFREFEDKHFGRSESAYTQKYFDCDLLIIDDLGTEMINQFAVSTLYSIINTRMIDGKATIINTNLSSDELRKRYTDRVVSRFFGEYTVIPFVGKDIRMQKLGK